MTDKKSNDSRRKLLKSIAAGSGAVVAGKSLPESWSKPIVGSVMLPAHAATTESGSSPETPVEYFVASGKPDSVIGGIDEDGAFTVCVSIIDAATARVTIQGKSNRTNRSGIIPLNGSQSLLSDVTAGTDCLPLTCPVSEAKLTNMTAASITVTHTDGVECGNDDGWVMAVPLAPCGGFAALVPCEREEPE